MRSGPARPRVLFLTYYFPPTHAIASVRTGRLAVHLSRLGWDVTVVTPDPALIDWPEQPAKVAEELDRAGVVRRYTRHRWQFLDPGDLKRPIAPARWLVQRLLSRPAAGLLRRFGVEPSIGWFYDARDACASLTRDDVDVVLATGAPWHTFRLAGEVAGRLGRPFVLDYRDSWTSNPHLSAPGSSARRVESELLRRCSAISVVSPSLAKLLGEESDIPSKTYVVSNGYDPAEYQDVPKRKFDHFAIVYAGRFYSPKGGAAPFLAAIRELEQLRPQEDWKFHIFGPNAEPVRRLAADHAVEHRIVIHGFVSRREALSAMAGAGAAVVITSVADTGDLADLGIVTGKIFEPIGLRTPVLAIAPRGSDVEQVLDVTGGGAVFTGSQAGPMAEYLAGLMSGNVPRFKNPEAYSWPKLVCLADAMLRRSAGIPCDFAP